MGDQQQYDSKVMVRIGKLLFHLGQASQEIGGLILSQVAEPISEAKSEVTPASETSPSNEVAKDEQTSDPITSSEEISPGDPAEEEVEDTIDSEATSSSAAQPAPTPDQTDLVAEEINTSALSQLLESNFEAIFGSEESPDSFAPQPEVPETDSIEEPPDLYESETGGTKIPENFNYPLYLIWEDTKGNRLAAPWNWVVNTHISGGGMPEAFTLSDGEQEKRMKVSRVRGIWTPQELETWQESVNWVTDLGDEEGNFDIDETDDLSAPAQASEPDLDFTGSRATDNEIETSPETSHPITYPSILGPRVVSEPDLPDLPVKLHLEPTPDPASIVKRSNSENDVLVEGGSPPDSESKMHFESKKVWIVSPSALARRFLMRHLDEMGLEVHEARDLDDPLLPADLNSAGALFLDESLQERWGGHAASTLTELPLVMLTVDGALEVPSNGKITARKAMLPRPFERAEVESIVAWLHSLWLGSATRESDHHGEEDDTWLFADPFGSKNSGKHSSS